MDYLEPLTLSGPYKLLVRLTVGAPNIFIMFMRKPWLGTRVDLCRKERAHENCIVGCSVEGIDKRDDPEPFHRETRFFKKLTPGGIDCPFSAPQGPRDELPQAGIQRFVGRSFQEQIRRHAVINSKETYFNGPGNDGCHERPFSTCARRASRQASHSSVALPL